MPPLALTILNLGLDFKAVTDFRYLSATMEFFAAAVGGVLTIAGAPFVLGAAGFTSAGIAAGSLAAGVQAGLGNVVVGSTFAALQSAGAAGLAASTTAALGAAGATGGALLCAAAECAGKEQGNVNCKTKISSY